VIDVNVTGCEMCNITYGNVLPPAGNFSMVDSFPLLVLDLEYTHADNFMAYDFSEMFKTSITKCNFTSFQIEKVTTLSSSVIP